VKKLEEKPFALIGVSAHRREPSALKEVMERENLPWRSFADTAEIVRTWNLAGTPTLYVIDHTGVIRHKWVGAAGEKAIDEALGKWIPEAEKNAGTAPK
jgi:peroxiredoxin